MTYIAPSFRGDSFTCPHCDVYAQFHWQEAKQVAHINGGGRSYEPTGLYLASCQHCSGRLVWLRDDGSDHPLYPSNVGAAPLPHLDTPEDVRADYIEAREIASRSSRGSAALLRLALQKLCVHLGERGENINTDIASLVQKGLPVRIQQALDVVRVTGNNAVHPGELSLDDNPEIAQSLFGLVNIIVESRIAEPKRIEALYGALPQGARTAIERRDA